MRLPAFVLLYLVALLEVVDGTLKFLLILSFDETVMDVFRVFRFPSNLTLDAVANAKPFWRCAKKGEWQSVAATTTDFDVNTMHSWGRLLVHSALSLLPSKLLNYGTEVPPHFELRRSCHGCFSCPQQPDKGCCGQLKAPLALRYEKEWQSVLQAATTIDLHIYIYIYIYIKRKYIHLYGFYVANG